MKNGKKNTVRFYSISFFNSYSLWKSNSTTTTFQRRSPRSFFVLWRILSAFETRSFVLRRTLVLLIISYIYILVCFLPIYSALPEVCALKWDFSGNVTGYGTKVCWGNGPGVIPCIEGAHGFLYSLPQPRHWHYDNCRSYFSFLVVHGPSYFIVHQEARQQPPLLEEGREPVLYSRVVRHFPPFWFLAASTWFISSVSASTSASPTTSGPLSSTTSG